MKIIQNIKQWWIRWRESWKLLKLIRSCNNSTKLLEIVQTLTKMNRLCMLFTETGSEQLKVYVTDTEVDPQFIADCKERLRNILINTIGREAFEQNIEILEPDTALAWKEADYQIARAEWQEAELQYYKAVNLPGNNLRATQLKNMYDRVQSLKAQVESFETEE